MQKKALLLMTCLIGGCFSVTVQANTITHTIGTTGYMIREATQDRANRVDPQNYFQAIKLQSEAKDYMRGTHVLGRNTDKSLELTKLAYVLAKQVRDAGAAQGARCKAQGSQCQDRGDARFSKSHLKCRWDVNDFKTKNFAKKSDQKTLKGY